MKLSALVLAIAIACNSTAFALQALQPSESAAVQTPELRKAAKTKDEVAKRGVGEKSRVRVLLKDKSEVKGYISHVDADSFQVTDKKNGQVTNIAYRDVGRIRGAGLSTGAKIAIGAGVAVGVVVAVALLSLAASGE